jgi:microcystin-dependent protein
MSATKFFVNPWAISGDKTAIPDPTQSSGVVSYATGYTSRYQLAYPSDPSSLAILRMNDNQLFYDVTLGLQQYQTIGVPNFVSTSDNLDTPFPYTKYSYALYDDGVNGPRIFQSKVNSNINLPTVVADWRWCDNSCATIIYDNVVFNTSMGNVVNDGDAVYWDVGNSCFSKAIANGAAPQNFQGFADVTNNRLLVAGMVTLLSELTSGAIYYLSTATAGAITTVAPSSNAVQLGTALSATTFSLDPQPSVNGVEAAGFVKEYSGIFVPAGGYLWAVGTEINRADNPQLIANTTTTENGTLATGTPTITSIDTTNLQPGWFLSGTGIPSGAFIQSVDSGTQITISVNTTTSGVQSLFFCPHGTGNGTTTFNIIDKRNRVGIGAGQAFGFDPVYLGQQGGAVRTTQMANQVAGHTHPYVGTQVPGSDLSGVSATWNATVGLTTSNNTPAGNPMTTVSPFVGCNYVVKT